MKRSDSTATVIDLDAYRSRRQREAAADANDAAGLAPQMATMPCVQVPVVYVPVWVWMPGVAVI